MVSLRQSEKERINARQVSLITPLNAPHPPANLHIINSVDKTIDLWSEERLECIKDANATQASRHVLSTLIQRVLYTSTDAALTRKPICW